MLSAGPSTSYETGPCSSSQPSPTASPCRDLLQIMPLPKHQAPVSARKRKAVQSIVFTSTPQKSMILDKENKPKPIKQKAIKEKLATSNAAPCKRPRGKKTTVGITEATKASDSDQCLFCEELYSSPPTEDWVQCNLCRHWAHESCTDYDEQNLFVYTCYFCR